MICKGGGGCRAITLTVGADNIVGTSGNDTVIGVFDSTTATNTTYTASDSIDGAAGTNTLQVTIQGAADISTLTLAAASVKNIQVASIRNVNANASAAKNVLIVDANTFVGVTELVADRSTGGLKFNNVGKADVSVVGNSTVANALVTIDVGTAIVTDAFTLNFKDGTKGTSGVTVADGDADWTEVTINSTGAANTTGALNLSGNTAANASTHTIKTLTINAATNLTTGNITGFDTGADVTNTIKVNGAAAKVKIGTVDATVDVIDASGLTAGGLTADLQSVTSTKLKVTGGAGNDAITTDALALSAADGAFVDAAGGTADVLTVSGATAIANDTAGKAVAVLYKNFEVLGVTNAIVQDASIFTGSTIGAVRIAGGSASTGFSKLSATQAANVTLTAAGTGNIDIGVKDATVTGNIDTVKLTVDDLVADNAKVTIDTDAAKLTLTGVEKLEITAVDNFTAAGLTAAADLDALTLKGAGNYDITTGAVHWAINSTIDASAATGTVAIKAVAAQAGSADKGLAIKGSLTNTNSITDSLKADVITGGTKVDTVAFSGGKDTLTLAAGADVFDFNTIDGTDNAVTFKFVAGDSVGVTGATTVAAAFAGKADEIKGILNNAAASATTGQKFTIDTDVAATAVKTGTSIVFGTTTVDNVGDFFVLYGDAGAGDKTAYAFQDSNSNGKIDADDFMIKLVGAADFTADEFGFASGNLVVTTVA